MRLVFDRNVACDLVVLFALAGSCRSQEAQPPGANAERSDASRALDFGAPAAERGDRSAGTAGGRGGSSAPATTAVARIVDEADAGATETALRVSGSARACAETKPALATSTALVCSLGPACSNAHCVPDARLPSWLHPPLVAACPSAGAYCVPDAFSATGGQVQLQACKSVGGGAGRCMSVCMPPVFERMAQLPEAGCAEGERCAPCYDPIDGSDTHVCGQACDAPADASAKYTFARCGAGRGLCVPRASVPKDQATPVESCTGADEVCAPAEKVHDPGFVFARCEPSILSPLGLASPNSSGQRGGCVPKYLPESSNPAPPAGSLMQDTCAEGEVCSPCVIPLAQPAERTGACPP